MTEPSNRRPSSSGDDPPRPRRRRRSSGQPSSGDADRPAPESRPDASRRGSQPPRETRRRSRNRRREERIEAELEGTEVPIRTPKERAADLADARIVAARDIPRRLIDRDALRVISRLAARGHEAYLVGGCVRDLLLERKPKDFDIATDAHPKQVKRLFRNGRIIGRRFKLVHVVYGNNIIETSTFRAEPKTTKGDGDLLIVDDNVFGSAAQDARRRDFTINGLFLDPLEHRIIDFVDGLEDVESGLLRTIGDPSVRMAEDPVRILRAVKFATRLDLEIEDNTWEAMVEMAPELARSAPARVVEEILRLLRSGHASPAFQMLDDCGALSVLLPEVAEWLDEGEGPLEPEHLWGLLDALDERIASEDEEIETGEALAHLFGPLYLERFDKASDGRSVSDGEALGIADNVLRDLTNVSRLSRRDIGLAKRVLADQRRFGQPSSKRFRPLVFVQSHDFSASMRMLEDRLASGEDDLEELVETWRERRQEAGEFEPTESEDEPRRRRRRRPSR